MKNVVIKTSSSIVSALCYIIIGLFLVWKSEATIEVISYILGGFIIALSVCAFVRYWKMKEERMYRFDIVYGIICLLVGLALIFNPHALASVIPLIIGIWITISSAFKVQFALQLKSYKSKMWLGNLIAGVILLLCGLILIFNPFAGAVVITKIIGIFLMIYALLDLISGYIVRKNIADAIKVIEK